MRGKRSASLVSSLITVYTFVYRFKEAWQSDAEKDRKQAKLLR